MEEIKSDVQPVTIENADVQKNENKPQFDEKQQKYIDELINKQYAKLQTKADEKLKQLEQAEKLKSLSEIDRAKEELKIAQEKLSQYENEKLINQFKIELTTKGLKNDIADFINVSDADKAKKAVEFFSSYKSEIEKPFAEKIKELEEQVRNASLRGNIPKVPTGSNDINILDKKSSELGYKAMLDLKKTNPSLYEKLNKK